MKVKITKSFIWGFLFSPIRCLGYGSPLIHAKPWIRTPRTDCRVQKRRRQTGLVIRVWKRNRSKLVSATNKREQRLRSTKGSQIAHSFPQIFETLHSVPIAVTSTKPFLLGSGRRERREEVLGPSTITHTHESNKFKVLPDFFCNSS